MRRISLLLLLVLPLSCGWADYKDDLIAKYPFYKTAVGKFAPVYPALAQQFVQDYGITKGVCVDMGGGCGCLAMALAKVTKLKVYVLDIDPSAVRLCGILADEAGLTGRVVPIEGDAQAMPFRDAYADLIVSRGSIFFWPDQVAGLKEAYRVLKPGGVAFIGGCFGRLLDAAAREELLKARKQGSGGGGQGQGQKDSGSMTKMGWHAVDEAVVEKAKAAGITQIRLIHETEDESWVEIKKPAGPGTAAGN